MTDDQSTGGHRELVIVCGATYWSGTRLLDQHLAAGLLDYANVLYIDPPISFLSKYRNAAAASAAGEAGLQHLAPGLTRLCPRVLPLKERPGGKHVALALTRRAMRRAVRELGSPPVRAVIVPSLNPLFGAVGERFSVFYASDDYVAGAELMGLTAKQLVRRAERQPRRADIVVGVSPGIVDSMRGRGVEPLLIPNGCDLEHFASTPLPQPSDPPVVGFVGHLSERVDVSLLAAVAATGVHLRIIGPQQNTMAAGHFDAVLAGANVEWTGGVDYADLPRHLADVTTCLVPYGDTAFNRASFPLKILEYLAAGRRVVSTSLPAVGWLATDLIDTGDGPDAFARAVTESLATPLTAGELATRRSFASEHTWDNRVRTLAEALGLTGTAEVAS